MNILKKHLVDLGSKDFREDGRGFNEYRKITIKYGVSAKAAEGSAMVTIGDTEVVAGVKFEAGTPFPDTPDKGTIIVNVELLPLASGEFESGPPGIDAIELSRVVDRGIRESGALDFKKLCITPGEKMWMIYIDIYPLNDDGNLFDACALAALAALKDARFPQYDGTKISYDKRTDKPLPLTDLPVSCTVRKLGDKIFVDPSKNEDSLTDARITFAVNKDGTFCAMQKGGQLGLNVEDIKEMASIAIKSSKIIRKELEKK